MRRNLHSPASLPPCPTRLARLLPSLRLSASAPPHSRLRAPCSFSPWLNLACDTPSYVSQAFRTVGKSTPDAEVPPFLVGDVAFPGSPIQSAASFRQIGQAYAGRRSVFDPIANPLYAPRHLLAMLPPIQIHTGMAEVLAAESAIFATDVAAAGGAAELHLYDGMWHCFPQYADGCEEGADRSLLLAHIALNRSRVFLAHVGATGEPPFKRTSVPHTLLHYEYPKGHDSVDEASYGCG